MDSSEAREAFLKEKQILLKSINKLRHDINKYEEQIEQHDQELFAFKRSDISQLRTLLGDRIRSLTDEEREIENDIKELIHTQYLFSGIKFLDITTESVESEEDEKSHIITGTCRGFKFAFQMVTINKTDDGTETSIIKLLDIDVDDALGLLLGDNIERFEEEKDIQGFFKVLSEYSEWHVHRRKAWKHFKETYPDIFDLPLGFDMPYAIIKNLVLQGVQWTLVWEIKILEDNTVYPVIDLLSKAPAKMLEMDNENVLKNAPEIFRGMLKTLGPEKAIDLVINTIQK